MVSNKNELKKELELWNKRKVFAIKNKDKETVHLANKKIINIKLKLKES